MEKGQINIADYYAWIEKIKKKIQTTRTQIALSVNSAILNLYWEIVKEIVEKQKQSDWGSKVIEKMAVDLKNEFPDIKGFSKRNIYAMRQWYLLYSQRFKILPQVVAQIPWGHNRLIISKTKDIEEALFYAQKTLENSWSRDLLEIQIQEKLYHRQGKAITNFDNVLPEKYANTAKNILKDPYCFDFLGLENDALEKAIEDELTKHITEFLLELGKGFAFVGSQYKIEISETEYFIDLLFYHLDLRCFVVIELKAGKFKPEYAGKLNFYLSAVDSLLKKETDNPSIGILLCRKKDKIEVEYALRDINKPLGISEYRLMEAIPDNLKTKLPSVEEFEKELIEKFDKKQNS